MSDLLDLIDLNLLRVLDVVDRERNLRRAAAHLGLTPSAVSHALARLRSRLEDPLFRRRGRTLVPTALASQLAPAIRTALTGVGRALVRRRDFDPGRDLGGVTLAMSSELEVLLLPLLHARLAATAPAAVVTTIRLERRRLHSDLAAGRFDAALDVPQPVADEVAEAPLGTDGFCVAAAATRRRLDRAAYLSAGHIVVSTRRSGPTAPDLGLGEAGVRRRVVVRCQSYETACRLAADSALLVTLPRRLAELRRAALPLRLFAPPVAIAPLRIHLYWLRERGETAAHEWLRAQLAAVAPEGDPASS